MPAGRRMAETESERIAAFQRLADERLDASYRLANAILGDESQSKAATLVLAWRDKDGGRECTRGHASAGRCPTPER